MDWALFLGLIVGLFMGIASLPLGKEISSKNTKNQPDNKTPFPTPENGIVSAGSSASTPETPVLCCCPKGHKLKVKSKLAGTVGICPVCKLRFQVPFESIQNTASHAQTQKATSDDIKKATEKLESDPELNDWFTSVRKTGPYRNPTQQ